MKRIALLSFNWDYEIITEYYYGLQERLKEFEDVQVIIFNAFGYFYARHTPKESSFKVFSLCELERYDGFLIQGNRAWPPEVRQQIVNKAVALHKPVVSINYDLLGAHSVGTDNYHEEYELISRILREHDFKKPAFVNGLKTSVEARARARAFNDACAQFDIQDVRFYQANWQSEAGIVAANKMLRKAHDLPDVVFCCNDDLAVAVQQTLQKAGVRVPEDVMITGFDNRKVGIQATPRITTIDRDYRTIAVTALDTILQLIDGKDLPAKVYSPGKHILAESCGYASSDFVTAEEQQSQEASLLSFYEKLADFQATVMDAEMLFTVFEDCEQFVRELGWPNLFLTLNDDYLRSKLPNGAKSYGQVSHLVALGRRSNTLRCNANHVYASFNSRQILPREAPLEKPIYTVCPLRHNDTCMGTLVTEGVPPIMHHGLLAFYLTMLSGAIDAVKNSETLRRMCQ